MQNVTLQAVGELTFWTAGPSTRERMSSRVADKYMPALPRPTVAVRRAMEQLTGLRAKEDSRYENAFVRELVEEPGVEIIMVTADAMEHRNRYTQLAVATMDDDDSWPEGLQDLVEEQYQLIRAQDVGSALVKMVHDCGAVTLRASGGIYWIPPSGQEQWERLVKRVEEGTDAQVYRSVWEATPQAVQLVAKRSGQEVQAEIARLMDDLQDGQEHADWYYENRRQAASKLRKKVAELQSELGVAMSETEGAIKEVEDALAMFLLA